LLFGLSFLISFLGQWVVSFLAKKTGCFIDRVDIDKPQRIHFNNTPRCGGLGIFLGTLVLIMFNNLGSKLLIASIPAFLIGFCEDLKSNLLPKFRLPIIGLSAILGILLYDAVVTDLGYLTLPYFIAILFTIFAVTGVTNAINIIDGFNGLASGISMIALICFGYVTYSVNDYELLNIILVIIFATLGFFVLNFPKGKIFLGDGGAYFLGFILAGISILLVNRHLCWLGVRS